MRKRKNSWLLLVIHKRAKWLFICCFIFYTFVNLLYNRSFGQASPEIQSLRQKALLFKNRVEYDSAVYYHLELDDLYKNSGDRRQALLNRINLSDIYILQRNYDQAYSDLQAITKEAEFLFKDDIDIEANLDQVLGSYMIATGSLDSARYYLNRSIKIRTANHGSNDTLLHYAYNKLGNLYLTLSDYDSAYFYHKNALDLSLKKNNPINYLSASSYQNLGIAAHIKGDINESELFFTKSLQIKELLFGLNDPALAKIYSNLGKYYTDLYKYNLALDYYDKSENLLKTKYSKDDIQFAHIYWNKGNVYTLQGDYIKATNYLFKAYSIFNQNLSADDQLVLNVLLDLGFAYVKKGDTSLAIEYYHQAAKNKDNAGIIKICRNLGNIYEGLNKPDSADKYYHFAINYANYFFSGDSYDLALCYRYYGEFLSTSKNGEKSLWYYSEASDILERLFGRKNRDLANVFRLESRYYLDEGDYNKALYKIQTALVALLPSFEITDPEINPTVDEIVIDLYLPIILNLKANALVKKYQAGKDLDDLNISLKTIHLTLAVIEEIRKTYNEEESQLILNKEARTVIDLGVAVTHKLYTETGDKKFLYEAFQLAEKGQSIILLSALRGLLAQSLKDIPRSVLDYEDNLSKELFNYDNLLYQEKQKKNPDAAKIQLWNDKLFNLSKSYDSLMASYEKLYPEFYRLKYDYSIISPDSVLMRLSADQAILEYHMSDSLLYGFLLTNQKLSIEICGQKDSLKQELDSLRQHFTRQDYFNTGQSQFESIISASSGLYDMLIRPFEKDIEGKRLIIIPDGELGYLSYDLLLDKNLLKDSQNYSELPWLIKSNPISYSSSATIYFEQIKAKPGNRGSNLLAFAPSYDFRSWQRDAGTIDSVMLNLSPITGTKEEIYSIAGQFKTKKRFDEDASEDYFKKHAGEYGILHLAMHTIIDNQNPLYSKLVFSPPLKNSREDGYLNTYELFSLKLPGQLAVLSACNTGSGKLERGEGIISLARGFFYAGIPSVLMTLWEIEDHSSANLMALFYENLKQGYPCDIALQKAKISYIESAGKLHSHPYFWAGYVSIGKTSPMSFSKSWQPIHFILSGTIFLILIVFIYLFINNRVFFIKKRH